MNPLAIRIAADIAAFKAKMAEMASQLDTNSKAMKRMSNSFDGSKVIGDANAMVIAIGKIGGASTLTEKEMVRVNATVTEAIAKYKLLGREAPPELLALRDATIKADKPMRDLGDSSTSLTGRLKGLAGTLGIAFGGAAVIAGIKSLISNTFQYAETIKDTSAKLGISMEATQRWKFAAEQTGASLENVSKSVLKLSQELAGGDKGVKQALAATGLEFDKIRAMKPEDAFNAVFGAISKIPDPMLQSRLMLELFGKSGAELIPAMREGFAGLAADVKTMSDETIQRLDAAKDKWQEFGRNITIISGEVLANAMDGWRKFLVFLNIGMTQGFGAAEQWRLSMIAAGSAVDTLSDAQKRMDAAFANTLTTHIKARIAAGESSEAIAKLHGVTVEYVNGLKLAAGGTDKLTAEQKAAIKEAERFAEAVQKQKEKIAGIITPTKEWVAALKSLGMELQRLPTGKGTAVGFFDAMPAMNDGIRVFNQLLPTATANVKSFFDQFKAGNVDPKNVFGSAENLQFLPTAGLIDLATGKLIPAAQAAGEKVAAGFKASIAKALEGLGDIIVGAIMGGGDVARAAFSHIGLSLGTDLGNAISKALGGTLGKIVGGFAGPLGALLGDAIGSLVGKLKSAFGWDNPGRDAIKAFFKEFKGGADGLREALLVLGDEGERLWIRLTQDARGPAQVKAAIKAVEDAFKRAEAKAKALRDEIARINSEGGLISADLKEWLGANPNDPEAQAFILGQIKTAGTAVGKMLEAMERAAKAVGKELKLTAGGAKAMSLIMLAAWDGSAQGLRDMAPDIERLRAALERSGIDGGKAFAQLSAMAKLASDEITGPMLEAINHGTSALTAMYNSGFLTQEVFQGLVDEIMLQRDALLKTGATADTVNAAMRNDLQRIWELVKDGKFAVDEKTAALLREAEAQGTVGDKYRSSTDRMVIALERLVKIFTQGGDAMEEVADSLGNKMVKVFTVTMVNAARDGVKQVQDLLNGIKMNEVVVNIRAVNSISASSPTGPSGSAPSWFGGSTTSAAPSVRNSSASFTIVNVTTLDGEVVARKTVKHTAKLLPGELQFTGGMRS